MGAQREGNMPSDAFGAHTEPPHNGFNGNEGNPESFGNVKTDPILGGSRRTTRRTRTLSGGKRTRTVSGGRRRRSRKARSKRSRRSRSRSRSKRSRRSRSKRSKKSKKSRRSRKRRASGKKRKSYGKKRRSRVRGFFGFGGEREPEPTHK